MKNICLLSERKISPNNYSSASAVVSVVHHRMNCIELKFSHVNNYSIKNQYVKHI